MHLFHLVSSIFKWVFKHNCCSLKIVLFNLLLCISHRLRCSINIRKIKCHKFSPTPNMLCLHVPCEVFTSILVYCNRGLSKHFHVVKSIGLNRSDSLLTPVTCAGLIFSEFPLFYAKYISIYFNYDYR